jgi:hypothetical protein
LHWLLVEHELLATQVKPEHWTVQREVPPQPQFEAGWQTG